MKNKIKKKLWYGHLKVSRTTCNLKNCFSGLRNTYQIDVELVESVIDLPEEKNIVEKLIVKHNFSLPVT